jgi:hypothetical protein
MKLSDIRRVNVDTSRKKTELNLGIQRLREVQTLFNENIHKAIANYERLNTIVDKRQRFFNTAKIGNLASLSLDVINANRITPHPQDYTALEVLRLAREYRADPGNTIGGGKRKKTKTKKKRA